MKKTKVFFMTLLVAIHLLGFSGTSQAFDLSKITEKPSKFVKYIAKKLGFGDSDEEKAKEAESEKIPYNSKINIELDKLDSYGINFISPVFSDEISDYYGWRDYNDEINLNYDSEDSYFRIGTRTGEIFDPFSYNPSDTRVWQTKVKYHTDLPWESFSQLSAELFLESTFFRQQTLESIDSRPDGINETYGLSQGNLDYSLRINTLVRDAKISLYGWSGNDTSPLNLPALYLEARGGSSDYLWQALNSGYYQRSNNLAATVSYELPFMSFFHHGMSPTIRLEAAYRFGVNKSENSSLINNDQWQVGMAYEGNSRVDWLNPYGINWGVGYNYTVTLDDLDTMDNLWQGYGSHSGNINANTYWFNMKLYTMFMYHYDRETRGSMTVLNATYSPDWQWSYGIKANFYLGKKDEEGKVLNDNSELVTFTATYRWD